MATHMQPADGAQGHNDVWCIDSFSKLEDFGFYIHGAMDAWSRCVLWLDCGVNSSTNVGAMRQYCDHISETGIIPRVIRKYVVEGGMDFVVNAHFNLRRIYSESPEDYSFEAFHEYVIYDNAPMARWWAQVTRSSDVVHHFLAQLRHFESDGQYNRDDPADRIALLAVYMPLIWEDLERFRTTWNMHRIDRRAGKPWVVPDRPLDLYEDGEPDFVVVVAEEDVEQYSQLVESHQRLHEYLPPVTLAYCAAVLRHAYVDEDYDDEFVAFRHVCAYHELRRTLRNYFANGHVLPETEVPMEPELPTY